MAAAGETEAEIAGIIRRLAGARERYLREEVYAGRGHREILQAEIEASLARDTGLSAAEVREGIEHASSSKDLLTKGHARLLEGDWKGASVCAREVLNGRASGDAGVLEALRLHAHAREAAGEFSEARNAWKKVLELTDRDGDPLDRAVAERELARLLVKGESFSEAATLLSQAIESIVKHAGPKDLILSDALLDRARAGETSALAERDARWAVKIREEVLGTEHPEVASALTVLWGTMVGQDSPQLENLSRRILEIRKRQFGENDARLLPDYLRMKRWEDSEEPTIGTRDDPGERFETIALESLRREDSWAEARFIAMVRWLKSWIGYFGSEDPFERSSLGRDDDVAGTFELALFLHRKERHPEACLCYERFLGWEDLNILVPGEDRFLAHFLYSRALYSQGKDDEAAKQYRNAAAIVRGDFGTSLLRDVSEISQLFARVLEKTSSLSGTKTSFEMQLEQEPLVALMFILRRQGHADEDQEEAILAPFIEVLKRSGLSDLEISETIGRMRAEAGVK